MADKYTLYLDESGTKHPDKVIKRPYHGYDWFAYGGILIKDSDKELSKEMIQKFRSQWPQMGKFPLHSSEIRGANKNFTWIGKDIHSQTHFIPSLERLLLKLPVICIACVVDRPGYNSRYTDLYKGDKWNLCKTAFAIVVDRAAKYIKQKNGKLRVFLEKSNKQDDAIAKSYYTELKQNGHWFDKQNSAKYAPLEEYDFSGILYEFKTKPKASSLMQIADLMLWPMCIGGYDPNNKPYKTLKEAGKLIDCTLPHENIETLGIKYSCFEQHRRSIKIIIPENAKAEI